MQTRTDIERTEGGTAARPLAARFVGLGLFYLGAARALPTILEFRVWRFPLSLLVASALAVLGWGSLKATRSMSRYILWALVLSAWVAISSVAAWDRVPLYFGRMFVLWMLFIIPGLASLLRDSGHRNALVGGLASGVTVLLCVAMVRVIQGRPMFDAGEEAAKALVLGVNRNPINIMTLVIVPYLVAGHVPKALKVLRLPLLGLIASWVLLSGGRSGLVGVAFVAVVYALIQPGATRRLRLMYALLAIATVALLSVQYFAGDAADSPERVSQTLSGESLPGDETRRLLIRKAWHLAVDNPVVGIGFGKFPGTHHPVVDEGSSIGVRRSALFATSHNTYTALMAEGGFPTLILFVVVMVMLWRGALEQRRSAVVRVATCGVAGLMLVLLVEFVQDPVLYLPLALLLGVVCDAEVSNSDTTVD